MKLLSGLIIASFLLLGVSSSAAAMTGRSEIDKSEPVSKVVALKGDREERIEKRLEQAEARAAGKNCEVLRARLTAHLEKSDVIKDKNTNKFYKIIDRLNRLADRADAADADTTELRDNIVTLEGMVADLSGDFAEYELGLSKAIAASCGDKAELKALIQASRENRQAIKTSREEIKAFLKETVKATLSELKVELEASSSEGEAD